MIQYRTKYQLIQISLKIITDVLVGTPGRHQSQNMGETIDDYKIT